MNDGMGSFRGTLGFSTLEGVGLEAEDPVMMTADGRPRSFEKGASAGSRHESGGLWGLCRVYRGQATASLPRPAVGPLHPHSSRGETRSETLASDGVGGETQEGSCRRSLHPSQRRR